ncbi:hypothetical protein PJF56_19995 [Roseofilum sp. BLCC_M91]|uniref:Uncharacterized protein n=1 Tax=Roseofilum halophilum BLCC-M91 TaxID=3022259 RepID=A0ABT7BQX3_9CYAN|nr:hypothetical protein [Roseofilum halophilum]MDJ1181147.1 hypothetical protein [Roseofilum halophilum BLCC-M91]
MRAIGLWGGGSILAPTASPKAIAPQKRSPSGKMGDRLPGSFPGRVR